MKGIIFNLAEEVVTDAYGEDVWDDVLDAAGVTGSYTSLGNYDDQELLDLVVAASEKLGVEPGAVVRLLGEGALPLLAQRFPHFFEPHASTRDFLLTLNHIIHAEVRKLYPGVEVPEFEFDASDPDVLLMTYRSSRRLCALAEGFIIGAARQYEELATLEQTQCMLEGSDHCTIECRFAPASAA